MNVGKLPLICLFAVAVVMACGCGSKQKKKADSEDKKEQDSVIKTVAGGTLELTFPWRVHHNEPKLSGTSLIEENMNCTTRNLTFKVKAKTNFAYIKPPQNAEERKSRFELWVKNNYRMGGTYRFITEKDVSQGDVEGIEMVCERLIDANRRFYTFRVYQLFSATHETTIVISTQGEEADVTSEASREFFESAKLDTEAFEAVDGLYAKFKPKRSGKTWAASESTRLNFETFDEPSMIEKFDFTFVVQKYWSRQLKVKNENVLENGSELYSPKGRRVSVIGWMPGTGRYKTNRDCINGNVEMYRGKADYKYEVTQLEIGEYQVTKLHFRRSKDHNYEVLRFYAIRNDWPGLITVSTSDTKEHVDELESAMVEIIRSARPIQ